MCSVPKAGKLAAKRGCAWVENSSPAFYRRQFSRPGERLGRGGWPVFTTRLREGRDEVRDIGRTGQAREVGTLHATDYLEDVARTGDKGIRARHALIQRHPETKEVGPHVDVGLAVPKLLRRRVARSSNAEVGRGRR